MINFDTYKKVQEMLKLGVKHKYICKNLGISQMQFYKYGLLPEDLFLKALQNQVDYQFETYRDYLISVLKVLLNINDTALLYKVKEEFSDFSMGRNTFFRHLKDLRNETGYIKNDRFGDYILVKEFEDFVRNVGFGAKFCHKWNPDTKGKIELKEEKMKNLDYLEYILSEEIRLRRENRISIARKEAKLPNLKWKIRKKMMVQDGK